MSLNRSFRNSRISLALACKSKTEQHSVKRKEKSNAQLSTFVFDSGLEPLYSSISHAHS